MGTISRENSQSGAKITTIFKLLWKNFNRITIKTVFKISVLLWASKSCYVIYSFILNNNSVEKNINIQQGVFFSFLKNQGLKNKKRNHKHWLFDNRANKNEAIDTLGLGFNGNILILIKKTKPVRLFSWSSFFRGALVIWSF